MERIRSLKTLIKKLKIGDNLLKIVPWNFQSNQTLNLPFWQFLFDLEKGILISKGKNLNFRILW